MEHHVPVREDWIVKDRDEENGIIGLEHKFVLPLRKCPQHLCATMMSVPMP